jgi:hypothetical protein
MSVLFDVEIDDTQLRAAQILAILEGAEDPQEVMEEIHDIYCKHCGGCRTCYCDRSRDD